MLKVTERYSVFGNILVDTSNKKAISPFADDFHNLLKGSEFETLLDFNKTFEDSKELDNKIITLIDNSEIHNYVELIEKKIKTGDDDTIEIADNELKDYHLIKVFKICYKQKVFFFTTHYLNEHNLAKNGSTVVKLWFSGPNHHENKYFYENTFFDEVFSIIQFIDYYKKIQFNSQDEYSNEILDLNEYLKVYYSKNIHFNQRSMLEISLKFKKILGKLMDSSIENYDDHSSKFYYYIMNLHLFKRLFNVDDELLNKIEKYKSFCYKALSSDKLVVDNEKLIKKIFMFQEILTSLLNTNQLFLVCFSSCLINSERNIVDLSSAIKIIDSINRFIKFILTFSNQEKFSSLFYDLIIKEEHSSYNVFILTYKELLMKNRYKNRKLSFKNGIDSYLNIKLFNSKIEPITNGYKKLIGMYNEIIKQFLRLKVKLLSIDKTFDILSKSFNNTNNGRFAKQFLETNVNEVLNNCLIDDEHVEKNLEKVCDLFNKCTNVIFLLLYLSSGCMQNQLKNLKVGEANNNLFIYKNKSTDKYYLHIKIFSVNKQRRLFINDKVTKIFFHYFFTIRLLLGEYFLKFPIDKDINGFQSLFERFDKCGFENERHKILKSYKIYNDSSSFFDNQLFIKISKKCMTNVDDKSIAMFNKEIFSNDYFKLCSSGILEDDY